MKVSLSDQELVGIWDFMRGPIWGNTPETMLAQLELWDAFEFDARFASVVPGAKMSDVSARLLEFELSDAAVAILRSYLARPGQPFVTGILSARALKRM